MSIVTITITAKTRKAPTKIPALLMKPFATFFFWLHGQQISSLILKHGVGKFFYHTIWNGSPKNILSAQFFVL